MLGAGKDVRQPALPGAPRGLASAWGLLASIPEAWPALVQRRARLAWGVG